MKKVPNKYNLSPQHLNKLRVLDWPRLKKETWLNKAMSNGIWWCHLEGSQSNGAYDDEDEFWIGFEEQSGKVRADFTAHGGFCGYNFTKFYNAAEIENEYDLNVQINTLRWLNKMIDQKILGVGKSKRCGK